MIRIFIGFFTTKLIHDQVEMIEDKWGTYIKGSWVKPQNLHITFQFIGEVEEGKVLDIIKAMQETAQRQKPIDIVYKSLGVFPNLDKARVLWIGVSQGHEELKALSRNIIRANRRVGIKEEGKPFYPHVTICRIKEFEKRKLKEMLRQYENVTFGTDRVDKIAVIKSSLTQVGPIYTVIEEFHFGG